MDKLRFLHIPKTAGSTFSRLLFKQYKRGRHFEFIGNNTLDYKRFSSLPKASQNEIALFYGHAPLVTGITPADEATIITILRDPVNRVKSFCQHVSEGKSPHLLKLFPPRSFTLDEFLNSGNSELSNLQSRMLINHEKIGEDYLITDLSQSEILTKALDNLFSKVTCFGLQEYFDESLILFADKLGWQRPYYENFNKKNTHRLLNFKERHVEKIVELNRTDIDFYQAAKNRFISIIQSDEYNKDELESFKRVQRFAAPIIKLSGLTQRHIIERLRTFSNRIH